MNRTRTLVGIAVVAGAFVFAAAPAVAKPSIKIQVKKNAATCAAPGDCDIFVMDRGVGVCETPQSHGGVTYCDSAVEWDLVGKGQLSSEHVVLIVWSPKSSDGSDACLDQITYVLTKANPTVSATVQSSAKCTGKMTWLYDVVLLYRGKEIDRDDPGVLIED